MVVLIIYIPWYTFKISVLYQDTKCHFYGTKDNLLHGIQK